MQLLRQGQPLAPPLHRHHLVAVPLEQEGQDAPDRLAVLDDQDRSGRGVVALVVDATRALDPQHKSSQPRGPTARARATDGAGPGAWQPGSATWEAL